MIFIKLVIFIKMGNRELANKGNRVAKKQKVVMIRVKLKSKVNGGREEKAGCGMTLSLQL